MRLFNEGEGGDHFHNRACWFTRATSYETQDSLLALTSLFTHDYVWVIPNIHIHFHNWITSTFKGNLPIPW